MADLPERFAGRMKKLLSKEWESFLQEAGNERQYGLRVNTLKISTEEFERIAPFHLTGIPWVPGGYYYEKEDQPARHPWYAAGLYYLQEPSAMTPASRLPVSPGDRVLDLCAAPGGKATALAAALRGEGLIVANDINTARARALLRNMEMFGVSNSLISNEAPHVLAGIFPGYFDKIMVDAPCSGEGMFRKNPAVMEAWQEKGPEYFSALQREIIVHGADMLKAGGLMFYSTCTFAPEENEGVITHLLRERPEMEVIPMEDYTGFAPGILGYDGQEYHESCSMCRRIWPHHMPGEGHFLALLRKKGEISESGSDFIAGSYSYGYGCLDGPQQIETEDGSRPSEGNQKRGIIERMKKGRTRKQTKSGDSARLLLEEGRGNKRRGKRGASQGRGHTKDRAGQEGRSVPDRDQMEALRAFLSHLDKPDMLSGLDIRGEKVYYVPDRNLSHTRLHFLRHGIYMGDLKKKRFEPSEPFALALSAKDYDFTINLGADDERLTAYLQGESIMVDDILEQMWAEGSAADQGWYLLLADGFPVGWGKLTGSVLKNKLPSGWRRKPG